MRYHHREHVRLVPRLRPGVDDDSFLFLLSGVERRLATFVSSLCSHVVIVPSMDGKHIVLANVCTFAVRSGLYDFPFSKSDEGSAFWHRDEGLLSLSDGTSSCISFFQLQHQFLLWV